MNRRQCVTHIELPNSLVWIKRKSIGSFYYKTRFSYFQAVLRVIEKRPHLACLPTKYIRSLE